MPESFGGTDLTLDPSFKANVVLDTYDELYPPLLLVVEVLDVKTTFRKSCAPNLLVGSDLT